MPQWEQVNGRGPKPAPALPQVSPRGHLEPTSVSLLITRV
ncbi:unnamed protein product [Tetraodon nigroviridis]|uniref:(spotted green pufferfish) hypothetical protein n=1 Tax=Tetraodon nigroviridis TaxID=99883 RepID=Q4SMR9_TETNG|nr:unnamed protein product [Tetraodon nigroviridis]